MMRPLLFVVAVALFPCDSFSAPTGTSGHLAKSDKTESAESTETTETTKADSEVESKQESHPLIDPAKLVPLLPEPPAGWKGEKPQSQQSDEGEIHLSSVRRSYYKGTEDDSPVAAVTIIDSVNNADYFDVEEQEKWEDESETEDGYDKRLKIDGMRVIEHYNKEAKTGSLSIFVGNRYFVQIELTNEDPKHLYDWLKLINTKELAALK